MLAKHSVGGIEEQPVPRLGRHFMKQLLDPKCVDGLAVDGMAVDGVAVDRLARCWQLEGRS